MVSRFKKPMAFILSFLMIFSVVFGNFPILANADTTKTVTICVQKPESWSDIYIWYRSDNRKGNVWDTTELGAAPGNMEPVPSRNGWYEKTITTPNEVTFLFNDGTWNNKLDKMGFNSPAAGNDFDASANMWFTSDGVGHTSDPYVPTVAKVKAMPGSESFSGSSVNVKLFISGDNVSAAYYTLDGSDPKASKAAVTFTSGAVVTVGSNLSEGSSATLKAYVKNGLGEDSESFTYTKVAKKSADIFNSLRIYQIMVASFKDGNPNIGYRSFWGAATLQNPGGDLQGIIDSLTYIKGTGVNAIWLTPVFTSVGSEERPKGYDPVKDDPDGNKLNATGYYTTDYFKIDPHFGSEAKLKELVDKAHAMHMYVLLDGVFGHCSMNVNTISPSGNRLVLRPGYNQYGNDSTRKGPIDDAASINFLKEVATYWIDKVGIDGWRCDQSYQVSRDSWRQIRQAVESKCAERRAALKKEGVDPSYNGTLGYMVAEDWNNRYAIVNDIYGTPGSTGLYSAFSFPVQGNFANVFINGASPNAFNSSFSDDAAQYSSFAKPNLFIDNHDMLRFGDLLNSHGISPNNQAYWDRYKEAISMLGAYSGPVTMFYNTEIGASCSQACPEYLSRFAGSCNDTGRFNAKTNYSSLSPREKDLYDYTSAVFNLKEKNPALWEGKRIHLIGNNGSQVYADLKVDTDENNEVLYVLNNSGSTTVNIPQSKIGAETLKDGITNQQFTASNGNFSIPMNGNSARFLLVPVAHSDAALSTIDSGGTSVAIPAGSTAASSPAEINIGVPYGYTLKASKFTAKDNGTLALYSDSAYAIPLHDTVDVGQQTAVYVKITSEDGKSIAYWKINYKAVKSSDAALLSIDDNGTGAAIPKGSTAASSPANIKINAKANCSVDISKFRAADNGSVAVYSDSTYTKQLTKNMTLTQTTTVYIKVTSEDGTAKAYWSITYIVGQKSVTVYFQKPRGWSSAFIWYRSDDAEGDVWNTTVLGASPGDMKPVDGHSDWYEKTVITPNNVTFLFNNGTWAKKLDLSGLNHPAAGNNFTTTSDVWVTNDGRLLTSNPWVSEKTVKVYFQKPSSWSNVFIWYRSDDDEGDVWDTTVLGASPGVMEAVDGHSDWYEKTVITPNNVTFLFNNGTWAKKLDSSGFNHPAAGNNFSSTVNVWVTNNGKPTSVCPY